MGRSCAPSPARLAWPSGARRAAERGLGCEGRRRSTAVRTDGGGLREHHWAPEREAGGRAGSDGDVARTLLAEAMPPIRRRSRGKEEEEERGDYSGRSDWRG